MTHGIWKRTVAMGLVVLLVNACATVPHEGRSGFSLPGHASFPGEATLVSTQWGTSVSEEEGREEAEGRRAEVEWALAHMREVARGEERVGAELEFTFWVERGALTLLSQRRRARGGERGQAARAEAFTEGLRGLLSTLAERRVGALAFTLHREGSGWRVDSEAESLEEPAEARKRPARRTGYPEETLAAVRAMEKQVGRLLQVPEGASASMTVELALEDDRLTGWEVGPYQAESGGPVRPAEAREAEALTQAVLPFTRGLGARTVRVELSGTHEGRSATSQWRVERAETLRPAPPEEALEDVLREYRQLHAQIFHSYREEMVDAVKLAGAFTLEQVALCVVAGLVGKGLHVAYEAVAPSVMKVVRQGGAGGMRWFRTQLVRAGRKDQELLRRLFAKVETKGFESLSTAERNELTQLLRRMAEQVQQVAAITQRHFERWFNKVYEPSQSDELLERATAAALEDVRALVAR